jgi:hypothetical protein
VSDAPALRLDEAELALVEIIVPPPVLLHAIGLREAEPPLVEVAERALKLDGAFDGREGAEL